MALDIKAAMLICMTFITGASWIVRQFSVPKAETDAPLLSAPLLGGMVLAEEMDDPMLRPADADRRNDWARGFEQPSALQELALEHLEASESLGLLAPDGPVSLPPEQELPPVEYVAADPYQTDQAYAAADPELSPVAEEQRPQADEEALAVELASSSPAEPEMKIYRVVRGDTLTRIARREWGSVDPRLLQLLIDANPKLLKRKKADCIWIGEQLRIPDGETARRVLEPQSAPLAALEAAAPERADGAAEAVVAEAETAKPQWYTIQPKDTLTRIAERFLKDGRRWREIAAINQKLDPHRIVPGRRIKLPPVICMAQR